MRHHLAGAILRLYPRRVRERHGPEIVALIDDLIAHEGRSRAGLFIRLAVDGLVQRIASTATVWTVVAVLVTTGFGGLGVAGFAAADAPQVVPRTAPTAAPAGLAHAPDHAPPVPMAPQVTPVGCGDRATTHFGAILIATLTPFHVDAGIPAADDTDPHSADIR